MGNPPETLGDNFAPDDFEENYSPFYYVMWAKLQPCDLKSHNYVYCGVHSSNTYIALQSQNEKL